MSDVKKLYDSLANRYLETMYRKNAWTRVVDNAEKQIVSSFWKLDSKTIKTEKILDLGMGPGRWSSLFLKKGFREVHGLDISKEMIKTAKKRNINNNFYAHLGVMEKLPFKDGVFDKIFCFRAFKYSKQPSLIVEEVERVLKKNGTFFLEVSNKSVINIILKTVSKVVLNFFPRIALENKWRYFERSSFYSRKDLENLTRRTKLRILWVKPLFVLPSIPLPSRVINLSIFYRKIDILLSKILPGDLFCRSWILLMRKIET